MKSNSFFGKSLMDRLNHMGASDQFSNAARSGNAQLMQQLLKRADYSSSSVDAMVKTFLNDPNAFKR